MEKIIYLYSKNIGHLFLELRPEEDFGFNYEIHEDYQEIGETYYGLVSIDKLIGSLQELTSKGANYVSCRWHSDHQELDLYGVEYRLATDEEITVHCDNLKKQKRHDILNEIAQLESKIKSLKNRLDE